MVKKKVGKKVLRAKKAEPLIKPFTVKQPHVDEKLRKDLLVMQKDEITAHHIYLRLSTNAVGTNKESLLGIAADEARHYAVWKEYTHEDVGPDKGKVRKFVMLSKVFGITFAIKVLEKGEISDQERYAKFLETFPEVAAIMSDEHRHEQLLFGMIKEEKLEYIGSMVLGLNDALVELTGTLAGLTLAFRNTSLVGISGLITGIAAALSMMSSEYLSKKSEGRTKDMEGKSPFKASVYTGIAYILTVILLVSPFFLIKNVFICLGVSVAIAVAIIAFFTYFTSVVHDEPYKRRFLEMAGISLGVALVSFLIGLVISQVLHIPTG